MLTVLLAATLSVTPSVTPPVLSRELLADAYLAVDERWSKLNPSDKVPELTTRVNTLFDQASLAFFRLDSNAALQLLMQAQAVTRGLEPADAPRVAVSLTVKPRINVSNEVWTLSADTLIAPLEDITLPVALWHREAARETKSVGTLMFNAGSTAGSLTLDPPPLSSSPQSGDSVFTLEHTPTGVQLALARMSKLDRSAISTRNEYRAAAKTITSAVPGALRIFTDRVSLLTDTPSSNNSAEFLSGFHSLILSLAQELETLKAGRSPYPLAGRWWSKVRVEKLSVPTWFVTTTLPSTPAPLLILLHGAGGDESMFVFGYGQGAFAAQGAAAGMVVVSPATLALARTSLPAYIDAVADLYPIDRERVYIVGHSMGAEIASNLLQKHPDLLAAGVCIAGGSMDSAQTLPPTLVIAAELDPLVPAQRLRSQAQRAQTRGLPLTFREKLTDGHTLIVGDAAAESLAFLAIHKRKAQAPNAPSP